MVGHTISKLKKERLVFILSPKYISPNKCDHTEFINQSRNFQSESTLLIASPGQQALEDVNQVLYARLHHEVFGFVKKSKE